MSVAFAEGERLAGRGVVKQFNDTTILSNEADLVNKIVAFPAEAGIERLSFDACFGGAHGDERIAQFLPGDFVSCLGGRETLRCNRIFLGEDARDAQRRKQDERAVKAKRGSEVSSHIAPIERLRPECALNSPQRKDILTGFRGARNNRVMCRSSS